jgi:hypothetical protein
MVMRFSTTETPGAAQASRAASSFSAQDPTPRRITLPPSTSTPIRRAFSSALRSSACSIFNRIAAMKPRDLSVIRLMTPATAIS